MDQLFVLIFSGVRGDTRRYRSFHPYEQLQLAGVPCQLSHITDPQLPAKIEQAAIVIVHRTTYDSYVARLFQAIQAHGGLAIQDIDDLIFEPAAFRWIGSPDFRDPVRAALYQEDILRNRATLEQCQAVIASTQYLAEQAQALNKPVWIHRNAFSLKMLAVSEQAFKQKQVLNKKIILGYASGTPTHDRDFAVAKPAIQQILRHHPEVDLWLIGPVNPGKDWGDLNDRIVCHKLVPWRQLPYLQASFDINIAPLVTNNPFAQSKSEIKYVEAGLVRVPTIASNTDAFEFAVRSGENGFLAASEADWIDALEHLIQDASLRRDMGERAYTDVLERYHPRVRGIELIDTLNQICNSDVNRPWSYSASIFYNKTALNRQAEPPETFEISETMENSPSLLQMGFYSLRHRGMLTLLLQIRVLIRRLFAPLFPYKKD
jgi:glycosyltransferase involved in cell wall biosynthesis